MYCRRTMLQTVTKSPTVKIIATATLGLESWTESASNLGTGRMKTRKSKEMLIALLT